MSKQQYLIDGEDMSLCIVYKKSIIYEGNVSLKIGTNVSYNWPEDVNPKNHIVVKLSQFPVSKLF